MSELSSKQLIKRLLKDFISKYYGKLLIAIFCMIIVAITTTLHAWMMKPILDKIFTEKNQTLLFIVPILLLIVSIIRGVTTYAQHVLTRNVENNILIDVQRKIFDKLLANDVGHTTAHSAGKVVSYFTNDVNIMRSSISSVLTNIIRDALSLVFLLALIFYYIPKLALMTFCIFPLAIYPVYYLGKKMRKISHNTQKELGIFTTQINETIDGIKVIKAHNAEEKERKRVFNLTENLKKLYKKSVQTDSLTSPLMETLGGISLAFIVGYGGYEVINENISTGTFFLFITAVLSAYKPMKSITKLNNQLQQGLAATQRIFSVLDTKPKVVSQKYFKDIKITKGNIIFDKVNFRYGANLDPALSDVSFNLEHGKIYAIVGKSGSGKSTIMNLILRFYDATKGKILIDKHNIKDFSFKNLRSQISYVSQDIFLFDDTVKANISYGMTKEITDEDIILAAQKSGAEEFIKKLEHGYDTRIGPRGNSLSGGQKQRLVIARAFLRETPILLLDEATSALDPVSEEKIKQAMFHLKQDRTCLVIAHRQETIINADRILVMKKGKIVATGTHKELLQNNDFYKHLFLQDELG